MCWNCDVTISAGAARRAKEDGARAGHDTADCPFLAVCTACGGKHTAGHCMVKQKGAAKDHHGGPKEDGGAYKRRRPPLLGTRGPARTAGGPPYHESELLVSE